MHMNFQPEHNLSQRLGYRLADILWHRHFELAELFGSLIWFLWGLALLNPFGSAFFGVGAYRSLEQLAPESVWGVIAVALALNAFLAMLWEVRYWRIAANCLLLAWGLFIGTEIGLSNPSGTGVVIYTTVGLMSFFAFLRAFRETV